MNLYQVLFELIDMRSFSNLWYWIMLAVMWSSASHWVLGVPFDLISRARRQGGALQDDLEVLVRINTGRMLFIAQTAAAHWHVPLLAFPLWVLTTPVAVPDLPLLRLDISQHLPSKRAALAEHRSQLGELVHDVRGFVLGDDLQALFVRSDELYLRCALG